MSFSRLTGVANQGFNPKLVQSRYFTYNTKYDASLYNSPINDNDIWKVLLCGPQVPVDANNYPQYRKMAIPGLGSMSTRDYLEWVANNVISPKYGDEVAQYLRDVYRFRADFDDANLAIDAISYLEYLAKDYTSGAIYYPIPSFQPYFDIMASQITSGGGHIYLNEPVLSVNRQISGSGYSLQTSNRNVTASTVVIAVPHTALRSMTGDVIGGIVIQPQFDSVTAASAITVTHQFGDGQRPYTGWWHGDIRYPSGVNLLGPQLQPSSSPLRRSSNNFMVASEDLGNCGAAKCDFTGTYFFNNTNELPLTTYHDSINVARSVYNDNSAAVKNWVDLYIAGGEPAVNRQILKSLRLMYPTVFTGVAAQEPLILATRVNVHDPAWYYLKAGAFANGVTNESLFAWSRNALPGERVYLIGDAWRPDLSGWSDAAYNASIYLLNSVFGASIDPKEESTTKCVKGDIVDPK